MRLVLALLFIGTGVGATPAYADDAIAEFNSDVTAMAVKSQSDICDIRRYQLASFLAGNRVSRPLAALKADVELCRIATAKLDAGDADGFLKTLMPPTHKTN